jgi:hypothetical protein
MMFAGMAEPQHVVCPVAWKWRAGSSVQIEEQLSPLSTFPSSHRSGRSASQQHPRRDGDQCSTNPVTHAALLMRRGGQGSREPRQATRHDRGGSTQAGSGASPKYPPSRCALIGPSEGIGLRQNVPVGRGAGMASCKPRSNATTVRFFLLRVQAVDHRCPIHCIERHVA